jgi:nitrate reductase NapE component
MYWLYALLAVAAFAVAFRTTSSALMAISLIAGLGFMVAWMFGLLAQRVGSRTRDDLILLDPEELRRLREQAEARKLAGAAPPAEPPR